MKRYIGSLALAMSIFNAYAQTKLPIEPVRTISFTTTEGSYMDVDLSPDGTSIVFTLLGDIYTLPITGGNATQITRGMAVNHYPVWSHDGKMIAYLSDISGAMHLNVMNSVDNSQRTLNAAGKQLKRTIGDGKLPVWMPGDNYIEVDDQLYPLAGGSMLLPAKVKNVMQVSPDGKFIYCNGTADANFNDGIERYETNTGLLTKFLLFPSAGVRDPKISPNGKWLIYISKPNPECNLMIRNIVSGDERTLVPKIAPNSYMHQGYYTFTPDSRYLLIGFQGKIHKIDLQDGKDETIPFTANVNVDLGPFNYNTFHLTNDPLQVRYIRSASVSPDGKQLVFCALNKIYTMTLPDGIPKPLVNQAFGQFQPAWSPDGKSVAYVSSGDIAGNNDVWRISASDGQPKKILRSPGFYSNPVWSPDGKTVAVFNKAKNKMFYEIDLVTADGATSSMVIDSLEYPDIKCLAFSADGSRILFHPKEAPQQTKSVLVLASVKLDGKDRLALALADLGMSGLAANGMGSNHPLEQISISPDGKYVVYQMNEDLYLSPLPNLGEPLILNSKTGTLPIIRFALGGIDPHWEKGGEILSWAFGNKFYEVNPDKIISMAEQESGDGFGIINKSVVPDDTITIPLTARRNYAHGSIALCNARIISMKGNEVIENGTLVIVNGRIRQVGTADKVQIPNGARIVNIKGKTVMPGLIDIHDHLSGDAPTDVMIPQWWQFLANLAYGVTSARDPSSDLASFGYAELLETGQMIGPRLFTVGDAIITSYHIQSLNDARELVKKRATFGAVTIKQYLQDTRLQKQWLLIASKEAGLNMTNEGEDPWSEIAMIKDGSTGVEHAYKWEYLYADAAQFIAKSGTWTTPTLIIETVGGAGKYFENLYRHNNPDPKLERFWPDDYVARLMEPQPALEDSTNQKIIDVSAVEAAVRHAGGHVGMGGHGYAAGIGSHWETWALQMGGLTNMEALQAATIEGAKGLGMQQDLGSIEVGKMADLIVLDKNPLDDIHNTLSIRYVMKGGVLYDSNTLDEIWPVKKKLPEWRNKNAPDINQTTKNKIPKSYADDDHDE